MRKKIYRFVDQQMLSRTALNSRAPGNSLEWSVLTLCVPLAVGSRIDGRHAGQQQIVGYFSVDMKSALGNNPTLFFW